MTKNDDPEWLWKALMAVILHYSTEFDSFGGHLGKWLKMTNIVCDKNVA